MIVLTKEEIKLVDPKLFLLWAGIPLQDMRNPVRVLKPWAKELITSAVYSIILRAETASYRNFYFSNRRTLRDRIFRIGWSPKSGLINFLSLVDERGRYLEDSKWSEDEVIAWFNERGGK